MTARIARLLSFVIALLVSGSVARAQTWTGGVKGGLGQGGFTGSSEFNWNQTSLSSAVFLNYSFSDRLGFQPEIAHQQKVGISRVGGSVLTLEVDYLEVPLLLQFKFPRFATIMPFALAGPNVAVSLRCKLKFVGGGLNTSDNCDSGTGTVRSRRFDFGGTVGGGISWPIGIATFGIEGRASAGLRSLVSPIDARNPRSFGWSAMASVSLPVRPQRIPRGIPGIEFPLPGVPMPPQIMTRPDLSVPSVAVSPVKRISVNAVDSEVRTLLIAVAQEADVNIVVSADVRGRVSVHLSNVTGMEAVLAIIQTAGLTIIEPRPGAPTAVVFYQLPIDVNQASRETIAARFGVSSEIAKVIVDGRTPTPAPRP